jgi:hypothetical protein
MGLSPFAWLSAVVPGFALVRVAGRFVVLPSMAFSVLAGLLVGTLLGRVRAAGWTGMVVRAAIVGGALTAVSGLVWSPPAM